VFEVRALSPVDLAVSKVGRFEDHERDDIATLSHHGLINERAVRRRGEEALSHYVGNTARVRTSLELACKVIRAATLRPGRSQRPTSRRQST